MQSLCYYFKQKLKMIKKYFKEKKLSNKYLVYDI